MPSHPPPPRTSRLDNVSIAAGEAAFELDGRPIRLDSEAQGPSFAALRELHLAALAEYQAHPEPRAPAPSPGAAPSEPADPDSLGRLFLRLGQWLGRFFAQAPARTAPGPAGAQPGAPELPPSPAEGAPKTRAGSHPPRAAAARKAGAAPRPEAASAGPEAADAPALQSVFADRDGIHLVWKAAAAGEAGPRELTCGFDSAVAQRLEACYGELGKLGYKVVGLELVRPSAEKPVAPDPPRRAEARRGAKPDPAPARSESEPGLLPGL